MTWSRGNFPRWVFNSLFYSVVSAVLGTLISVMAGYAVAKYQFPGKKIAMGVIMGGLLLPVALLTIPLRSAIRPAVILGSLVGVIPLIVMFLGLQKYWRAGLAAGAVKG